MTTIAIDRYGTIAADGQRTWGGDIVSRTERKIRIRHGRIYALAGTAGVFEPLIAWHGEHNADPEKTPKIGGDNDWQLIVIDRFWLIAKYTNTCPYADIFERPPLGFGAGVDLAKGAMLFGATAEQAVRLAIETTNHSGGEIQVVNIAEALGLDVVKEAAE